MKKLLSGLIAASMLFALCACGGTAQPQNPQTPSGGSGTSSTPPAGGGQTYNLTFSVMQIESDPAGESAARIVEKVAERTNNNVVLTPYYNGQLGDYAAVMTEIQMGTIDMAYQSFSTEIDPVLNITNVPYSATDWDQVKKLWAPGSYPYQVLDERFANLGVKFLSPVFYGFMGIGGTDIGDFSDILDPNIKQDALLRVPVMESYVTLGQAMGFRTTTLPWGDLYSALQTGIADGCIGASASNVWLSFGDVINTYIDMNYVMEIGVGIMNLDKFNALPEEYRQTILEVFEEERVLQADARAQWDKDAVEQMAQANISTYQPTAEELEPMAEHIREVCWPYYAELLGQDVLDQYLEAVEALK